VLPENDLLACKFGDAIVRGLGYLERCQQAVFGFEKLLARRIQRDLQ
jgi:hypothetical protein